MRFLKKSLALIAVTTTSAFAAEEVSVFQPGKFVTTILSDNCIVTAGYKQNTVGIYDFPVGTLTRAVKTPIVSNGTDGHVQGLVPSAISGVLGTVGVELAQAVIKLGVKRAGEKIADQAKDTTYNYSNVVPTNLYSLGISNSRIKEINDETVSIFESPVSLNPRIRCVTIITNVNHPIETEASFYTTPEKSSWESSWLNYGPGSKEVARRLSSAGIKTKNPSISTVFEAKWEFSTDGQAIFLEPRFFRVLNHYGMKNGKGTPVEGTRSIAYTVTLAEPGELNASTKVASQTFTFEDVSVDSTGKAVISYQPTNIGYGPALLKMLIGPTAWQPFAPKVYDPSDKFKKAILGPDAELSLPMEAGALNVKTNMVTTKKGSELFKFLSNFFEENKVGDTFSEAIISGLNLHTDEQEKTKVISKIDARITTLEAYRDLYILKNKASEGTDDYKEKVQIFEENILELKVVKLELQQGCDPTGLIGTPCL
jgi:hypothetical protein